MPRARILKPQFFTDSKTGTLTDSAKSLFIGMLIHADDYGVIRNDPAELKAAIFPFSMATVEACIAKPLTVELIARGLVRVFSVDSASYLFIANFPRHQHVNHPSRPLIEGWKHGDTPETFASRAGKNGDSRTTTRGLPEDSGSALAVEGWGGVERKELKADACGNGGNVENPDSVPKRGSLQNIDEHKMPAQPDPQARRELLKSQIQMLRDVRSERKGPTASPGYRALAMQAK